MNTLTEKEKINIISEFGITNFLTELPIIDKKYCLNSYDSFIKEYGCNKAYWLIIDHIIIKNDPNFNLNSEIEK